MTIPVTLLLLGVSLCAVTSTPWRPFLASPPGPSEDGIFLSPVVYDHTLDGPAFSGNSSWFYLTQWSNTHQLNASAAQPGPAPGGLCHESADATTLYHIQTDGALACMQEGTNGKRSLLVRQDGGAANISCGAEFDMFIAPTDKAYSNIAQMNIPGNVSMGSISTFVLNFTLDLLEWSTIPRCGAAGSCGPSGQLDYGYMVLGVVMDAGPQTIYYQVILADTRGAPSCPSEDPCTPVIFWFETTLPTLGISESIAHGYPNVPSSSCMKPGAGPTHYSLDTLYDRLIWSILTSASNYGSNPNPSAWFVTGFYIGSGIEGSTTSAYRISDINVAVRDAL